MIKVVTGAGASGKSSFAESLLELSLIHICLQASIPAFDGQGADLIHPEDLHAPALLPDLKIRDLWIPGLKASVCSRGLPGISSGKGLRGRAGLRVLSLCPRRLPAFRSRILVHACLLYTSRCV